MLWLNMYFRLWSNDSPPQKKTKTIRQITYKDSQMNIFFKDYEEIKIKKKCTGFVNPPPQKILLPNTISNFLFVISNTLYYYIWKPLHSHPQR